MKEHIYFIIMFCLFYKKESQEIQKIPFPGFSLRDLL